MVIYVVSVVNVVNVVDAHAVSATNASLDDRRVLPGDGHGDVHVATDQDRRADRVEGEEEEEGLAHGRRTTEGERERGREQSRSERGRHDGWLRLTRNSLSRNCLSQNACLGKLGALALTAVPPPPCLSFCPLYLPYFYFSSSYSVYYSIPHHEQTASSPHCDGSNREWHWHSSPQPAPSHRGPPILSNGKER